ncbi:uncharacterized protein CLUP02_09451 [Colletotrichum lupini]|uniref:Uncharacterized protein n=1 Tax=Colletotrichum lupini TaxID=145971 RepID=A0A9Q8SUZ6_9PEZI|nr:uncharacterized protein CLUP02_09451 [Colletotrichum lupini]UQC83955.1 hypothetical protein CLUP02_09451 [Colletotrichum lupini]
MWSNSPVMAHKEGNDFDTKRMALVADKAASQQTDSDYLCIIKVDVHKQMGEAMKRLKVRRVVVVYQGQTRVWTVPLVPASPYHCQDDASILSPTVPKDKRGQPIRGAAIQIQEEPTWLAASPNGFVCVVAGQQEQTEQQRMLLLAFLSFGYWCPFHAHFVPAQSVPTVLRKDATYLGKVRESTFVSTGFSKPRPPPTFSPVHGSPTSDQKHPLNARANGTLHQCLGSMILCSIGVIMTSYRPSQENPGHMARWLVNVRDHRIPPSCYDRLALLTLSRPRLKTPRLRHSKQPSASQQSRFPTSPSTELAHQQRFMQHLIQHLHSRSFAFINACQTRYLYQAFNPRLLGVPGFGAVLSLSGPEGFPTFPQRRSIFTEQQGEGSRTACEPFPIASDCILGLFEAPHRNYSSCENASIRLEISDSDYTLLMACRFSDNVPDHRTSTITRVIARHVGDSPFASVTDTFFSSKTIHPLTSETQLTMPVPRVRYRAFSTMETPLASRTPPSAPFFFSDTMQSGQTTFTARQSSVAVSYLTPMSYRIRDSSYEDGVELVLNSDNEQDMWLVLPVAQSTHGPSIHPSIHPWGVTLTEVVCNWVSAPINHQNLPWSPEGAPRYALSFCSISLTRGQY